MLTNKQYIFRQGRCCPNCESEKVVEEDRDFWDEHMTAYKLCEVCGSEWIEEWEYKLTAYRDVEIAEDLPV